MSVVLGVWFAFAGAVAVLAGLSGIHRSRRLRRTGVSAWAMAVPSPASAGGQPGEAPSRTLIQYALADGQVVERTSPPSAGKAAALRPGQKVLVWYDPKDPQDALVYGREGRLADRAFVAVGALVIGIGMGFAAFG